MMFLGYYDKDGHPITMEEMAALHNDMSYKRVWETTLPDGRWISTVWLGLDHSFGDTSPLIFETMVFRSKTDMAELSQQRYSTRLEALVGHMLLVGELSNGTISLTLPEAEAEAPSR